MTQKAKAPNPFTGRWRIVSMSAWDEEFIDEEEEGYFEFDQKDQGQFHFGYVHGQMDCRLTTREGEPAVEWTWDGNDEMDPAQGRGWAVIGGDEIEGMLFFHQGDESGFQGKEESAMIQRHNYGQQCWWCGSLADSREHRYKKADITRLFGKGPYQGDDALSRVVEGKERLVQGPKSKELMFEANLCQKCNNERSQPFDLAYDQFIAYLESNSASILSTKQIQFSSIFGSGWQVGRENVVRYYAKHIGCRLAEADVLVDSRVTDYLDGKGPLSCIEIAFEIRDDIVAMEAKLLADQLPEGGVWIGDGMADSHPSNNTFSRFYSHVGYRWLRATYEYDDTFTSEFNVSPTDVLVLGTGHAVDPTTI